MSGELHPYIFNPAPRDHVVINGRLNYVGDVGYTYIGAWEWPPDRYINGPDHYVLIAVGVTGDTEIGTAYTEEAAIKAQQFMKRA
jgi:hypothetical protein